MNQLVGVYVAASRWTEAVALARDALMRRERGQLNDWRRFHTKSQLGAALAGQKEYIEAEPMLLEGYEGMKVREAKIPAPSKKRLAEAAARIVSFYEDWGKLEKAAEWRMKLALSAAVTNKPKS